MKVETKKVVDNLVGLESEVHVFFRKDANEHLKTKAACMLLAVLRKVYGQVGNANTKICPYVQLSCGGQEFLPNGSRAYLDHNYLEYATPTCKTTSQAVAAIRAGDRMIRNAVVRLHDTLGNDVPLMAVRNNVDHRGHSFGAHVNIRMSRQGFERIFNDRDVFNGFVVPFFVTLPVICGSGRCSSEDGEDIFQVWQRSDFIKESETSPFTTSDRPLVNSRDEALTADPDRYARFHIIAFDANRLEVAEFLKLGLLRLLCAAIDAGCIDVNYRLDEPISAIRSISRWPYEPIRLARNKTITALEIQRAFLGAFTKLHDRKILENRVPDSADILAMWDRVLTKLETNPFGLVGCLDWVTKYVWLEQTRSVKKLKWSSPEMKWLDIQYHCLTDGDVPLVPSERVTTDKQVVELIAKAPKDSRAALRGELLRRFADEIDIAKANWHYLVGFDGEIAYLLPDDPEPGLSNVVDSTTTLKRAANFLNLTGVRLDNGQQREIKVVHILEQKEKSITL